MTKTEIDKVVNRAIRKIIKASPCAKHNGIDWCCDFMEYEKNHNGLSFPNKIEQKNLDYEINFAHERWADDFYDFVQENGFHNAKSSYCAVAIPMKDLICFVNPKLYKKLREKGLFTIIDGVCQYKE